MPVFPENGDHALIYLVAEVIMSSILDNFVPSDLYTSPTTPEEHTLVAEKPRDRRSQSQTTT